ncbi:MAG: endonuclease/exonuclease/phosphatase family protein [Bacteroidota bacterium]|nr:endonuclease/exonuclease/phosphatase family protein [Bacteroidota bacterium]
MAVRLKAMAQRFFILLSSILAFLFLLTWLGAYLHPSRWWFISLLGLGFPVLLAIQLLFIIFWLLVRPKYVFIPLTTLLIGWRSISVFFSWNSNITFQQQKPKDALRVLSWNVARFIELNRNNNKGSQTRLKMLEQIKQQNADIVCMQEFYHSTDTSRYNNIRYFKEKLGYPYFCFSWDPDGDKQWFGQAIFSRYPIIDSGLVHYPKPSQSETLIYADVAYNGDTIRMYTTHLQSVGFKKPDYERIEKIKNREERMLENSRNIFSKLKRAAIIRAVQTDIVKEVLAASPHPYIITGDFNDVPNSYTYFTIKSNGLQDAFLQKGFGIGRTFTGIAPTLRIDYILPTEDFRVLQFNRIVKDYSDHYMLLADVKLSSLSP